jgi:hypothetical protein
MCFHLYLASPLTLSEIRSMLPTGMGADLLEPAEQRRLRAAHPDAQTSVRLIHGACSCDLIVQRHPVSRSDEAWLRQRYRAAGLSREQTIAALERHRKAAERRRQPAGHWPTALAAFVGEHARNAGPSLFFLHFGPTPVLPELPSPAGTVRSEDVRAAPDRWLPEETPLFVLP